VSDGTGYAAVYPGLAEGVYTIKERDFVVQPETTHSSALILLPPTSRPPATRGHETNLIK
jgi:hypothetical protein